MDKKDIGDTSEDFYAFHKHTSTPGKASTDRISLVVQWLRICLVIQGTWVQPLVRKLRFHMLWGPHATARESVCHNEDPACCN